MSTLKSEQQLLNLATNIKIDGIDIRIQTIKFLLNQFINSKSFKKNKGHLNVVSTAVDMVDDLGELKAIMNSE